MANRAKRDPSPDEPRAWLRPWSPVAAQFLLFAGCGLFGTLAHYAVLFGVVSALDVRALPASVAGFLTGMVVNYFLNYHITFRSSKRHRDALAKFLLVGSVGLALNTILMYGLTELVSLHYLVSQLLATGAVLTWNFAANRLWTFHVGRLAVER